MILCFSRYSAASSSRGDDISATGSLFVTVAMIPRMRSGGSKRLRPAVASYRGILFIIMNY